MSVFDGVMWFKLKSIWFYVNPYGAGNYTSFVQKIISFLYFFMRRWISKWNHIFIAFVHIGSVRGFRFQTNETGCKNRVEMQSTCKYKSNKLLCQIANGYQSHS